MHISLVNAVVMGVTGTVNSCLCLPQVWVVIAGVVLHPAGSCAAAPRQGTAGKIPPTAATLLALAFLPHSKALVLWGGGISLQRGCVPRSPIAEAPPDRLGRSSAPMGTQAVAEHEDAGGCTLKAKGHLACSH